MNGWKNKPNPFKARASICAGVIASKYFYFGIDKKSERQLRSDIKKVIEKAMKDLADEYFQRGKDEL